MSSKGDQTREHIVKEAYKLFARKGFKQVTMKDICESTKLSRGGLYRHYAGTDEILSEILSKEYAILDQIEQGVSARNILEELLEALREEMGDSEKSLSLAIYEYASLGHEDFFIRVNEQAKKRWNSLIQYGIETGEFKKVDGEQITDLILYSYQGVRMWSRVIPLEKDTVDHIVNIIRELLL